MKVDVREAGGIGIVDVAGRLSAGEGREAVSEAVRTLVDSGHTRILVNLTRVRFMDSTGICELIRSRDEVVSRQGSIHLVSPGEGFPYRVIHVTRLDELFGIYENELSAVSAFVDEMERRERNGD